MIATVICLCGKRHRVEPGGKRKNCSCGAQVWVKALGGGLFQPMVLIPEDSLEERMANGKRVLLRKPSGRGIR